MSGRLRETAKALLEAGDVSVVVGHAPGSLPEQMVPAFVTDPEEAADARLERALREQPDRLPARSS